MAEHLYIHEEPMRESPHEEQRPRASTNTKALDHHLLLRGAVQGMDRFNGSIGSPYYDDCSGYH